MNAAKNFTDFQARIKEYLPQFANIPSDKVKVRGRLFKVRAWYLGSYSHPFVVAADAYRIEPITTWLMLLADGRLAWRHTDGRSFVPLTAKGLASSGRFNYEQQVTAALIEFARRHPK